MEAQAIYSIIIVIIIIVIFVIDSQNMWRETNIVMWKWNPILSHSDLLWRLNWNAKKYCPLMPRMFFNMHNRFSLTHSYSCKQTSKVRVTWIKQRLINQCSEFSLGKCVNIRVIDIRICIRVILIMMCHYGKRNDISNCILEHSGCF